MREIDTRGILVGSISGVHFLKWVSLIYHLCLSLIMDRKWSLIDGANPNSLVDNPIRGVSDTKCGPIPVGIRTLVRQAVGV